MKSRSMRGGLSVDKSKREIDTALDAVDEGKRSALKRLIGGGAFATPIVASFAMGGLTVDALAQGSNTTASGRPLPSDRRLKTGIARLATHPGGFGLYRFRYLWSDTERVGVMAQEVQEVRPDAVKRGDDDILRVDYAAIGAEMVPYAVWEARTDSIRPALQE
jgi:hypothetical protein